MMAMLLQYPGLNDLQSVSPTALQLSCQPLGRKTNLCAAGVRGSVTCRQSASCAAAAGCKRLYNLLIDDRQHRWWAFGATAQARHRGQ